MYTATDATEKSVEDGFDSVFRKDTDEGRTLAEQRKRQMAPLLAETSWIWLGNWVEKHPRGFFHGAALGA